MKNKLIVMLPRSTILLLILPIVLLGQMRKWESIGPEGGNMASVVQDPTNPDVFYTVPFGKPAHIFKSFDHGATWVETSTLDEAIVELKFHPFKPGLLYALSSGFSAAQPDSSPTLKLEPSLLYFSNNGGGTWDSQPFPPIYAVLKIVFDPKDPATIHALARTALSEGLVYLKSIDNGETWSATEVLQGRGWGTGIAIDPRSTDNIYVAAYPYTMTSATRTVYKSSNGGVSFSGLTVDARSVTSVNDIVTDPEIENRVFVVTYFGVYRSDDAGQSWVKNKGSLSSPQKLWINPKNSKKLIVKLTGKGVAESNDEGATWIESEGKIPGSGANSLIVESGTRPSILVSNSAGIFRSDNKGASWKVWHTGIKNTQVMSLRLAPSSPGILLAGLMTNAVYKADAASGQNVVWQQLPIFYTCTYIGDILIDPKKPEKILALEGGG